MNIAMGGTRLTSVEACNVFGNESRGISGDYSLNSILRYLALTRSDGDISHLEGSAKYDYFTVSNESDVMYVAEQNNPFAIIVCESGFRVEESPDISNRGWRCLDTTPYPVCQYLSKFSPTKVYTKEDTRQVLVVVEMDTREWLAALESVISRIMPWFFTSEITEAEQKLFRAIAEGNEQCFIAAMNEAASTINFKELYLHKVLDGYANRVKEREIETLTEDISIEYGSIRELDSSIAAHYNTLSVLETRLKAIELVPDDSTNELLDFFKTHKQLFIRSVSGERIKFGIEETIEYYDEDELKRYLENEGSYFYKSCSSAKLRSAYKALFLEKKGLVRVTSCFEMTSLRELSPISRTTYTSCNVMPHPHLYYHGCLGGNGGYISKAMREGNWQIGIEQAIGATKNINFGDSIVMREMLQWFKDNMDSPCILIEDGRIISMKEFQETIVGGKRNG